MKVASNLLSDREKDELHHLVDTMVSYSLAYKYLKGDPQEKRQNLFADASEDLPLFLDPPISDFVNFKVLLLTHSLVFYLYIIVKSTDKKPYMSAGISISVFCTVTSYKTDSDA
jgi:hypothetical protein